MTQRRLLERQLASLSESGEIIRSMKNLAYMETRKLGRLVEHQRGVVQQIDAVAADFLSFHPETLPHLRPSHSVFLVIGSRRGFCGDFNERLADCLRREIAGGDAERTTVIAVGHKLSTRLEGSFDLSARLEGADVAEEVPSVLRTIVDELEVQRGRRGPRCTDRGTTRRTPPICLCTAAQSRTAGFSARAGRAIPVCCFACAGVRVIAGGERTPW